MTQMAQMERVPRWPMAARGTLTVPTLHVVGARAVDRADGPSAPSAVSADESQKSVTTTASPFSTMSVWAGISM
jgi:hypothetical protein